jgi:DNA-directed RNA polymerase specialized sigma24 family protein
VGRFVLDMRSRVSAEELAKIAGVKVTTVRRTAHELLELLERDLESQGIAVRGIESS